MKDKIEIGDIVVFALQDKVRMGRVVQVSNFHQDYIIVPLKGTRPLKIKYSQLVSAKRIELAQQNASYIK